MKNIHFIVFLFFSIQLSAEEYFTLSLNELVLESDRIVEATWLHRDSDYHTFLIKDFFGEELDQIDTIVLNVRRGNYTYSDIMQNSERVLLFLGEYEGKYSLIHSGYRVLANDTIFQPEQPDWGFPFEPHPIREKIDWYELERRLNIIYEKTQLLLELKNINDPVKRNKALFDWIEQNRHSFSKHYSANSIQGPIDSDVLRWIIEAGDAHDTWRAAILMKELFDRLVYNNDNGVSSFCSTAERTFLLSKIQSDESTHEEKEIALHLLGSDHSLNCSNSKMDTDEQKNILKTLKPLLKREPLKSQALKTIKQVSKNYSRKYNIDKGKRSSSLHLLPYIIRLYKKMPPSKFRSDLATYIVPNISDEEWEKLSGSQHRILISLSSSKINQQEELLNLGVSYRFGEKKLERRPILKLEKVEKGKIIETKEIKITSDNSRYFSESFKYGSVATVKLSTKNLSPGTWRTYLIDQINGRTWRSEPLIFQL